MSCIPAGGGNASITLFPYQEGGEEAAAAAAAAGGGEEEDGEVETAEEEFQSFMSTVG